MEFWDGGGISWTMCKQSAPRSRQTQSSATRSQLVLLNSYLSMSAYTKHQVGRHIPVPYGI